MLFLQETPDGVVLSIYIQPRSSKNAVIGLYGDALKIKLTAPPVEGEANKMCAAYLSKCLGVPKSDIEIVSGHSSRRKKILVRWAGASEEKRRAIKDAIRSLVPQKTP
ncbi:MAG: YggU family protein [Desulfobacteraceae bacterium]|nr:MAG: YggU family protein [Desulfobacteraceae bacterium]